MPHTLVQTSPFEPLRGSALLNTSSERPHEYVYTTAAPDHSHRYLLPVVSAIVTELDPPRVFDLGCGNGSFAQALPGERAIVGVDPSQSAIELGRAHHSKLHLDVAGAYDDLAAAYGTFPLVISMEVVEHLMEPRRFAQTLFALTEPGGTAVVSTPYHGYLKNLALAVTGRMDQHFSALWDGGHIKFWSRDTLSQLLREAGFTDVTFTRVGRIPQLAKSMIARCVRPI